MKWGYKFYQSRVFVFEGGCVLLWLGWFCLFESGFRVSSKLRFLGIFKVRLRIPSEVQTLSRLRVGYKAEFLYLRGGCAFY